MSKRIGKCFLIGGVTFVTGGMGDATKGNGCVVWCFVSFHVLFCAGVGTTTGSPHGAIQGSSFWETGWGAVGEFQ
jgi:hypothetical protein